MLSRVRILAPIFVSMVLIPATSRADLNCRTIPDPYAGSDCFVGGNPVCEFITAESLIRCDEFGAGADEIWAVSESDTSNGLTWGTAKGDEFCCSHATMYPIEITTYGGNDTVDLSPNTIDGDDYYWEGTSEIYTGTGDDYVDGSDYSDESVCYLWLEATETVGSAPCDAIYLGAGDDGTNAGGGDDLVQVSVTCTIGDDLYGGAGSDKIFGGAGDDIINGQGDDDVLRGGAGNDDIGGGAGEDWIFGNDGVDTLSGGDDNDVVCGGGDDGDADDVSGDDGTGDYCASTVDATDNFYDCETENATCTSATY